jgi:soluble lytic murein transglycosylase-like protein
VAVVVRGLALALWAGLCWGGQSTQSVHVALSSIYALTESDGSLALSNVPTDRRYAVFVGESAELRGIAATKGDVRKTAGAAKRGLYSDIIERTASLYGLESALLHAVIEVESGYEATARSPKGASGLMQLMPGTASRYGVADAFDPAQNIDGGARYLRDLLRLFDSDLALVLAAYNAGEGAVTRYQNRVPPYRETLEYVPKVLAHWRRHQGAASAEKAPEAKANPSR